MDKKVDIAPILKKLFDDNLAFSKEFPDSYFETFASSQSPQITMLSCSDSRVQSRIIADDPFNQVFVIRNIGNQIANNFGSVDYGINHLNTPILIIIGHTDCGAVKAFVAGYDQIEESIKLELDSLKPSISEEQKKADLISTICQNIHYQVSVALDRYKQKVDNKELIIVGAYYDIADDFDEGSGKIVMINLNGEKM